MQPFSNHNFQLYKGDVFYLFSDGLADQFGGEKGKKFKYSQMKQIFTDIHAKPAEEQKKYLESAFDKWKGQLEQVDDVCIIGVRA